MSEWGGNVQLQQGRYIKLYNLILKLYTFVTKVTITCLKLKNFINIRASGNDKTSSRNGIPISSKLRYVYMLHIRWLLMTENQDTKILTLIVRQASSKELLGPQAFFSNS